MHVITKHDITERELRTFDDQHVRFKTLELALNFDMKMERLQLLPLPSKGMTPEKFQVQCFTYLQLWADLILAEKRRQQKIEVDEWPAHVPWEVKDVYSMPMVIWIKKTKK